MSVELSKSKIFDDLLILSKEKKDYVLDDNFKSDVDSKLEGVFKTKKLLFTHLFGFDLLKKRVKKKELLSPVVFKESKVKIIIPSVVKKVKGVVYGLLCNEKLVYIGKTAQEFERRISSYSSCFNNPNTSKYNKEVTEFVLKVLKTNPIISLHFVILAQVLDSRKLNEAEVHYIKEFNTIFPSGLNKNKGGGGGNAQLPLDPVLPVTRMPDDFNPLLLTPEKKCKFMRMNNGKIKPLVPRELRNLQNVIYRILVDGVRYYGVTTQTFGNRMIKHAASINASDKGFTQKVKENSEEANFGIVYQVPEGVDPFHVEKVVIKAHKAAGSALANIKAGGNGSKSLAYVSPEKPKAQRSLVF